MKLLIRIFLITISLIAVISVMAQDRAVLRRDDNTHYRVEVFVKAKAVSDKPIVAALYSVNDDGKRKQIQRFEQEVRPSADPDFTVFDITVPVVPADDDTYIVSVFEFPTTDGLYSYDLPVGKLLSPVLTAFTPQCPNALQLRLNSKDYTLQDWQNVYRWINTSNNNISNLGDVIIATGAGNSKYPIRGAKAITDPNRASQTGFMLVCVQLKPNFPNEAFNATLSFNSAPGFDLQKPIVGTGLKASPIPKTPTSADDNGVPGQRGLERNLDLGISFSSAVEEKTRDDGSKFVQRTNRGTFDIRLAPLLKTESNKPFDRDQKWYRYFTPGYIDAAVSTGTIDKDTLSMNRVILGTEYEWRYYDFEKSAETGNTKTDPYVTFHRIILSGTHASDRDFKQKEFLATIEYQPVIGFLNHPMYLDWKFKNGIRSTGTLGYEIVPKFGFTIGKTYQRRNPAEVIKPSETARRFHVGLDMTFNLSQYFQLSIKDTMYIRGEAPDDRIHNYFKGTIEAPLGRPFANSVNSLFLTFERGNQPPFATRDVNVFKIGYRIRSEGWFDRFR